MKHINFTLWSAHAKFSDSKLLYSKVLNPTQQFLLLDTFNSSKL